jgi:hypothetical protein
VRLDCPFVNLPETHKGRWGEGLTADEMRKCVWVQPKLVAQVEFLEWTGSDHLRHPKFAGLREDKTLQQWKKSRAAKRAAEVPKPIDSYRPFVTIFSRYEGLCNRFRESALDGHAVQDARAFPQP